MSLFDHLIDKGKQPKEGMEYVIMLDIAVSELYNEPAIKKGTIVKDVKIKTNEEGTHLGYDFTIVETGQQSHTNYPWALAEKTDENMMNILIYEQALEKLTLFEKEVSIARTNIERLCF